jgi:hypothetical protein
MAVTVPVATSPSWPTDDVPQGQTGTKSFAPQYVVYPPQTEEQKRLLRELVEWSVTEGGLDPDVLMQLDEDAWGITHD